MIKGFETYTHDLTDMELRILPGFIRSLKERTGANKSVTAKQIIDSYKQRSVKLTGARVRKIIHHIRMTETDFVVMASSKGYWVTTDPKEIEQQIESLTHRAFSQIAVANQMKKFCEEIEVL